MEPHHLRLQSPKVQKGFTEELQVSLSQEVLASGDKGRAANSCHSKSEKKFFLKDLKHAILSAHLFSFCSKFCSTEVLIMKLN